MASQEHLQQLAVEDSSTSSDESSGREESAPPPPPSPSKKKSMGHPKMRLKLSLKQTSPDKMEESTTKDATPTEKAGDVVMQDALQSGEATQLPSQKSSPNDGSQEDEDDDDVPMAHAAIVDSGDDAVGGDDSMDVDEEIQEATLVSAVASKPSPTSSVAASATSSAPASSKRTARRSSSASTLRPAKMPPMPSPGLLVHPTSDGLGFATPAAVFDQHMATAGYTTEQRMENPHRGSSVKRVVGDMFDSEVHFSLHFPELIPEDLWDKPKEKSDSKDEDHSTNEDNTQEQQGKGYELAEALVAALSAPSPSSEDSRPNRKTLLKFSDMAPLSITIPYPDSYIEKQVEYVQKVDTRERAIIASQEATLAAEEARARYEEMLSKQVEGSEPPGPPPVPAPVHVPPIPEPPSPPKLSELQDTRGALAGLDETEHPLYPPKGTEKLMEHLDKGCFHITDGRYFGLMSNAIADPQFVGPSAPGIQGLSFTAASGLSTCSGSSGVGLATTLSHHGSAMATTSGAASAKTASSVSGKKKPNGGSISSTPKNVGPDPSSSSTKLRQIMEAEDAQSEAMQKCILRAAVYACRTEKHRMSFVGVDGETYPDISKAFATYAGIRPCDKCKTNKQGSYHCRLRRKHKGLDYDGGNSPALLAPLFQEPLDDLLTRK